MQKDIEKKRTVLITAREQLAEKKVTIEEKIKRELDLQSINSKEKKQWSVIKYINTVDLEDFGKITRKTCGTSREF